jgi:hypothetical protein
MCSTNIVSEVNFPGQSADDEQSMESILRLSPALLTQQLKLFHDKDLEKFAVKA